MISTGLLLLVLDLFQPVKVVLYTMKIGINFISFRSYQGTEIYAAQLLSELFALDRGIPYVLFGSALLPGPMRLRDTNVSMETVRVNPEKTITMGLYQQIVLPFKLMAKGITRFYAPLPSIPVLYPGKKIMTIHDCAYDRYPEYKSLISRLYIKSMYLAGKYVCDAIITDSHFAKQELITLYGMDPSRIKVIYPGIPALPRVDDAFVGTVKKQFNITRPYFLYVGITRPRKNLPGLLRAFKLFLHIHPGMQLVLAGRIDTSFVDIGEEIRQLGIGEHVVQTGFVSDEQKTALYKGALALVFPSSYEGFGIPVIEAQSLGTPVLTSGTSSLPEVAGEGALYVDPSSTRSIANGMERILDDTLRQDLMEKGLKNVGRFSWKRSASQLLTTLNPG